MTITITKQIVPNGPIETYSNRPMTVNGVRIQPTWPWSDAYRKIVRVEMAKFKDSPRANASLASESRRWYKAKFDKPYRGEGCDLSTA